MRIFLMIAGLLLLAASCQREYPKGHPSETASASSVWDFMEIEARERAPVTAEPEQEPTDEPIEPSIERGPRFSETDTVEPALLPGVWLQFCQSVNERISPLPLDQMDVLEIGGDGQLAWHFIANGRDNLQPGSWEKTDPGYVSFYFGDQPPLEARLQMFGEDFFFIWSYQGSVGWWFARLPEQASQRIEYNHFTSNLGEIHIESINDNIFQGTAGGDFPRDIIGFYTGGVLVMRWEEPETNAAGYAAFIVAPDWSKLDGVWWIDDYEAAPFGGPYTAEPVAGSERAPE